VYVHVARGDISANGTRWGGDALKLTDASYAATADARRCRSAGVRSAGREALSVRLLLVEDDAMIGRSLQQGLKQDGYAVDWVRDGQAARGRCRMRAMRWCCST
jgi:PleD family two-component response regulator